MDSLRDNTMFYKSQKIMFALLDCTTQLKDPV